jgi:hypothetical protein
MRPFIAIARIDRQITPMPDQASQERRSPSASTLISATSSGAVPRISG